MGRTFPNRDELSLRMVLALPSASRTGLEESRVRCTRASLFEEHAVRKRSRSFAVSVLPAPESPLIRIAYVVTSLRS